MDVDDQCESGGDSENESLAALAFDQLHLDTVTVDIRVQAYKGAHGEPERTCDDPTVFVLMVLGHRMMRPRGKMYTMPMSMAKAYEAMGVVRALTEEEVEAHAMAETQTPVRGLETPDISRGLTTAARIHNVRQADSHSAVG